jgi:hypothetical protein
MDSGLLGERRSGGSPRLGSPAQAITHLRRSSAAGVSRSPGYDATAVETHGEPGQTMIVKINSSARAFAVLGPANGQILQNVRN